MRVITLNVNGIRSAASKGFYTWLSRQRADVVCLQELKAQPEQLDDRPFRPPAFETHLHCAQKKGYSGVAVLSRVRPRKVVTGIGWEDVDVEGRYIELQFDRLNVVSLYVHSGSASEERQQVKFGFLERFLPYLQKLRRQSSEYVICGDWNIAHRKIDLKNWRGNQKNSGFLPEEREWMDALFDDVGYVDAFRVVNQDADEYTWWSNRGQAWAKNVGWRIDYQIVTPGLRDRVQGASIYRRKRFSDHRAAHRRLRLGADAVKADALAASRSMPGTSPREIVWCRRLTLQ